MEKNVNRVIRVCELWYVNRTDVVSVTKVSDKLVDITLDGSAEWVELPFTKGTATISEAATRDDGGKFYKQELMADISGEDEDMVEWSMLNDFKHVILKVVQNNGTKIYGDLNNPVKLYTEWNSENSSTTLKFTREATDRARWLNEETSGS
jgi:hypothetical protein